MSASGKSKRTGISLIELAKIFPDEDSAVRWFEETQWPNGRCCGHCGGTDTNEVPNRKPMPYWCPDCRHYFSVRTGTALEKSRLPLRKWAFAVYIFVTSLKSVSSVKLHSDIDVRQATAWFMLHRLREAWDASGIEPFNGPVEADETHIGGKYKNMHGDKRRELRNSGADNKITVVGMKDRPTNRVTAKVIENTNAKTLQGFVKEHTAAGATIYTDEATAYGGLPHHKTVNHSARQYVKGDVTTNAIESAWSLLKRSYHGTFHHFSRKHAHRYIDEFCGRWNHRPLDTIDQMRGLVRNLVGKRMTYKDLTS